MKKLWIALLSAVVIFAIAMPASAVDLKLSGSYFAGGYYISNPTLFDKDSQENAALFKAWAGSRVTAGTGYGYTVVGTQIYGNGGSAAYFTNRLRMQADMKIVEGLTLVTRFDALERVWGEERWAGGTSATASRLQVPSNTTLANSQATTTAQQNIEFERAYVDFVTGIGRFLVGYQQFGTWGTTFADTSKTAPGIGYYVPVGPVTLVAKYAKWSEGITNVNQNPSGTYVSANDVDKDEYDLAVIYKGKAAEAGLLYQFARVATTRAGTPLLTYPVPYNGVNYAQDLGSMMKVHALLPYFKGTFGPVYLESELLWGKAKSEMENAGIALLVGKNDGINAAWGGDLDFKALAFHLNAQANFGMFYVGGIFDYASGDDPATLDTREGGLGKMLLAGDDYNPCLILWNTWYGSTSVPNALPISGAAGNAYTVSTQGNDVTTFFDNAWMYQVYFGVKPTPKTDVKLSVTYAYADKKPTADVRFIPDPIGNSTGLGNPVNPYYGSDKYGWEVDLVASYKIFDNLTYEIGGAYHFVGDWFKGPDYSAFYATPAMQAYQLASGNYLGEPKLANNYLLMHKLTLSF